MQESSKARWTADLKVFAVLSAAWAVGLAARVVSGTMPFSHFPLEAIIGGMKFYGETARIVLGIEAGIFALYALAILAEWRWGLILALCYLTEAVMSHFIFILAYMNIATELGSVQIAAIEGPVVVLLLLYVWIRSHDLLFGTE